MRQGTVRKGRKELWIRLEWRDATVRSKRWHLIRLVEQRKSNLSFCNLPCHILNAQFCAWACEVMTGCWWEGKLEATMKIVLQTNDMVKHIKKVDGNTGVKTAWGQENKLLEELWKRGPKRCGRGIFRKFVARCAKLRPLLLKGPSTCS